MASIMLLLAGNSLAQNAPTITTQPVNQVVSGGGQARFTVAASGDGPFAYQWRLNGTNLPNIITTFAGGGYGDGGQATNAVMNQPQGVAVTAMATCSLRIVTTTASAKYGPTASSRRWRGTGWRREAAWARIPGTAVCTTTQASLFNLKAWRRRLRQPIRCGYD